MPRGNCSADLILAALESESLNPDVWFGAITEHSGFAEQKQKFSLESLDYWSISVHLYGIIDSYYIAVRRFLIQPLHERCTILQNGGLIQASLVGDFTGFHRRWGVQQNRSTDVSRACWVFRNKRLKPRLKCGLNLGPRNDFIGQGRFV